LELSHRISNLKDDTIKLHDGSKSRHFEEQLRDENNTLKNDISVKLFLGVEVEADQ